MENYENRLQKLVGGHSACNLYAVQTVHKVGLLCMCAGPKKGQLPSYRSTDSSEFFFFF